MTLSSRNSYIIVGMVLSGAFVVVSILALYQNALVDAPMGQIFWFIYAEAPQKGIGYLAITLMTSLSFLGFTALYLNFRKTHAPEVAYLAISLAGEALQGIRLFYLFPYANHDISMGVYLTRISYFGYFCSILGIFLIGMNMVKFEKWQPTLLPLLLASFAFCLLVPIDGSHFFASYLFAMTDERLPFICMTVLAALAILGPVLTMKTGKKMPGFILGTILSAGGLSLLFFSYSKTTISVGFGAGIAGMALLGALAKNRHIWGDSLPGN